MFSLGTAFWFLLIIIGYFFRGPSWQWYWPWESWEIHKESHVVTHSWSIVQGIVFLVCYVAVGLGLPIALPYIVGPKVATIHGSNVCVMGSRHSMKSVDQRSIPLRCCCY